MLRRKVSGQLVDDGGDDFQVGQFFGTYIGKHRFPHIIGHGVSLGEIPHSRSHLPVRPAVLAHNKLSHLWVWLADIYRVLQPFFIVPHGLAPPLPSQGHLP